MSVVVYRFGCPHWAELPVDVDQQLRLAHDLREDLVTLEQQRQDAVAAVWSEHPQIADCEQRISEAEAEAAEVGRRAAQERSTARKRGATASTPALTDLRRTIREQKKRRRELISQVRPAESDRLSSLAATHRAAVKETYRTYCRDGELYWATYNDTLDHHKTAMKRINQARAAGKPATLRHDRFDGSGTLAVQLKREAHHPPRSPALLGSGQGPWRNVLQLSPWVPPDEWRQLSRSQQRRRRLGTARLALGRGQHLELPVIVHRMLPAEADVTSARLVVRRVGGHRKVEMHVTAKIPDPNPATSTTVGALHLGWRADDDAIRVGTWRTTTPLTVPESLSDVVLADTDRTGRILLPARLVRRNAAHNNLRAQRDVLVDKLRAELVDWLTEHGPVTVGDRELTASDVARWRAPRRFARLAMTWRANPPQQGADIAATLEEWRRQDRSMWEPEVHGRGGVTNARDDAYRRASAWLTEQVGTLVVDDTVISEVARRPDPSDDPAVPTVLEQRASHARTLAAPGRLRELAVTAAQQRGVTVATVSHSGITRTHHRCGHLNPADGRYARSRTVTCDGCGQGYDQDASATLGMLDASGQATPSSAPGPNGQ